MSIKEKNSFMKSTEEYITLLKSQKEYLTQKYQIRNLGLFGSVARNEQTKDSDVDIYFECSSMSLFTMCRLKYELEKILGCTVDLLRKRKQLEGTSLEKSIKKDLIYV